MAAGFNRQVRTRPLFLRFNEADGLQHPDVLHQTRQRHVEWLGEFPDRGVALAQTLKDRSPGWVRKSAEHKVELDDKLSIRLTIYARRGAVNNSYPSGLLIVRRVVPPVMA